jgi:hypothetical protein
MRVTNHYMVSATSCKQDGYLRASTLVHAVVMTGDPDGERRRRGLPKGPNGQVRI